MGAFDPSPLRAPVSGGDYWRAAAETPFNRWQNFSQQFQEGVLSSPGTGTVARDFMTPRLPLDQAAEQRRAQVVGPLAGAGVVAYEGLRRLFGAQATGKRLDEAGYKSSPYYRKAIPYDPGMTEDRAAALATFYDIAQSRARYADREAWNGPFGVRLPGLTSLAGGVTAGFLDPVNFIPVFGPAARAAAVAKIGFVAGHGLLGASEAAINAGAFGLLTAQERAQYGDDVSFEAQINNIAFSAIAGGVLGGVSGGFDRRATLARADETRRLQTVSATETSRAVLNDAVTGLVVDGEVKLSPAAGGAIERMSSQVAVRRDAVAALARETADVAEAKPGKVVITPQGTRVEVRPEVVDLATLQSASGDLQVRDRTRAASGAQIEQIGRNLDPARLMPSLEADRGAPIVGPDNIIDSGNGRVAGIQRAYEVYPEQAATYRKAIEDAGYSTEGMSQPVLISRRTTSLGPEARSLFNAEANMPATARMSGTELAAMDARAMPDATLLEKADGPVTSGENRAFVQRFLAELPKNERGSLVDANDVLNSDGARRVERAVVAAAYGDVDQAVIARFAEATDDNTASIVGAMSDVAGRWALMRRAMKAGDVSPEFDLTPELTSGLSKLSRWREQAAREGRPVSIVIKEGLGQLDILDGEMSLEAKAIIRAFYKTDEFKQGAGREAIAMRLGKIVDAATELGRPQLFGDATAATKLGVLQHAIDDGEADIFAAADAGTGTDGLRGRRGQRPAGADRGNAAQGLEVGQGGRGQAGQLEAIFPGIIDQPFVMPGGKEFTLRDAQRFYTGLGYAQINKWAREGAFPDKVMSADKEMASASIRKLIDSAAPLASDVTVFRGKSAADNERGFRSYSTDRAVAEQHATKTADGIVEQTVLPKGTRAIVIKEGGEREIIALPSALDRRPSLVAQAAVGEPALDLRPPRPEPPPDGLAPAAARVGTSEDLTALAGQHGVNSDGSFAEQTQIDAIRDQLSEADLAELDAADQTYADAKAWGDAILVAAHCAFGV